MGIIKIVKMRNGKKRIHWVGILLGLLVIAALHGGAYLLGMTASPIMSFRLLGSLLMSMLIYAVIVGILSVSGVK